MNTLRIEIEKLPLNSRPWDELYITGDFCGWFPDVTKFHKKRNGIFWIDIVTEDEILEFKITRGSWKTAECKLTGELMKNHVHEFTSHHDEIKLSIENWEDRRHSASSMVILWREKMLMKPMRRKRNVWVYLPPNYEESKENYPVLYMQDGQNLFDVYTSFSGEWGIDKTLNTHFTNTGKGCIVVAIENEGKYRTNEYVPWNDDSSSCEYAQFIAETLKPAIDAEFRTLPNRENTGIGGSSYGALISIYTGIKYQEIFSKILAFSPVFFDVNSFYSFLEKQDNRANMFIYFLAGKHEGEAMAQDIQETIRRMYYFGFKKENLYMLVHPNGEHIEWFWQQEFANAFRWLFK